MDEATEYKAYLKALKEEMGAVTSSVALILSV